MRSNIKSKQLHSFTNKKFLNKNTHKHNKSNPSNINTSSFNTKDINYQTQLSEFIELEDNLQPIKISTINIAGNLLPKLKSTLMYMWDYNIDILVITETHFKDNVYKGTFKKIPYFSTQGSKFFYIYHNSKSLQHNFTSISVIITEHIYHRYLGQFKDIVQGRLIRLSLKSSNMNYIDIFAIYVNTNDSQKLEAKALLKITLDAIYSNNKNHNIILLGDFNIDPNKEYTNNRKAVKSLFIKELKDISFVDAQKHFN